MKLCHNCGAEWTEDYKPGYSATCENCGYELHCCKNCRFYDTSRYNNCAEPMADRVSDHEMKNFCTYFEFIDSQRNIDKPKKSRSDFDKLFNN
ncbi:MAG: hypothetical protein ACOCV8_01435 [Spirochaetota bacterium]